jgi:hypothetical protein
MYRLDKVLSHLNDRNGTPSLLQAARQMTSAVSFGDTSRCMLPQLDSLICDISANSASQTEVIDPYSNQELCIINTRFDIAYHRLSASLCASCVAVEAGGGLTKRDCTLGCQRSVLQVTPRRADATYLTCAIQPIRPNGARGRSAITPIGYRLDDTVLTKTPGTNSQTLLEGQLAPLRYLTPSGTVATCTVPSGRVRR